MTSKAKAYLALWDDWVACRDADPVRAEQLDSQLVKAWLGLSVEEHGEVADARAARAGNT